MGRDERIDAEKIAPLEEGPSLIQQAEPNSLRDKELPAEAAALQSRNERFRGIIENADAGYFRVGVDGRFQDVNPAWLRMHGFSRKEDVVGLHFSAVLHPDDVAKAKATAESLIRGESVKSCETSRFNRDGTIGYHSFSANPVLQGDRVIGVEGFLIDITDQKTAEQERQKSEQRYRLIAENAADVIWLWDIGKDRHTYVSPSVHKLLGFSSEEIMAQPMHFAMSTHSYEIVVRQTKERIAAVESGDETARTRMDEIEYLRKDGSSVVAERVTTLISDDQGAVRHILGVSRDITDRKRIEDELWKSEQKFVKAFESSPAVTILAEHQDSIRFILVNDAFEQVTGYRRDEAIGRTIQELGLWADPREFDEAMKMLRVDGKVRNFEFKFRRKNGDIGTGWISSELMALDSKTYSISTAIDITERKAAEEALRNSEERFYNVFRSSPAATIITDRGRIILVNDAFERTTGHRRDEVIGLTVTDLGLWSDPADRQQEVIRELETYGYVRNVEHRFRKKNGDVGIGLLSIEFFSIAGKQYAVGTNVDITDRKVAEEERKKLEDQLRQAQKMESIGRLAGGIAHDFNNLLTIINGYASLLATKLDQRDPLWSNADEIRRAGERAAGLTKQLLAFSRKQLIEPKTLDLNTSLRDFEQMLRRLIGEDISITMKFDASLGQVKADLEQFHQVIMNLVINARDAMPHGGAIEISTVNAEVSEDEAASRVDTKAGQYVMVTVSDTGTGIDEKIRQHIFEPFFTTKEKGKGTGLGLATVYGIMRQSGGWIDVLTKLGVGTSFKLYFPRTGATQMHENREAPREPSSNRGETILVVEDQDPVRHLMITILERHGYRILEATSGEQAFEIAEKHSGEIHLLLTDVVLPGINGKQLSDRLNTMRPTMKVLFTSGFTADIIAHSGVFNYGMAFMPKPFTPDRLAAKVLEVLAESSRSQGSEMG
jgi:two-component system cell cycle sensor histidine kinase/response regulator CckA